LAASYALGPAKDVVQAEESSLPDKVSDIMALIGTTILWVFWPSFVGATETSILQNEHHCIINTVLALLASTSITFCLSPLLSHQKYDPVHIANSTLAGGVAVGSAGRLNIGPGMAILTGTLAGAASVYGYTYSSPYLERKLKIYDTCGVGNLHGYPSVVGALLSVAFIALDPSADFLTQDMVPQMVSQVLGIIATLLVSSVSGYGTGAMIASLNKDEETTTWSYQDHVWWHLEY
jgi:ammonium transporter Rh